MYPGYSCWRGWLFCAAFVAGQVAEGNHNYPGVVVVRMFVTLFFHVSFFYFTCHSERSEESIRLSLHPIEILRFAQDDSSSLMASARSG